MAYAQSRRCDQSRRRTAYSTGAKLRTRTAPPPTVAITAPREMEC